MDYTPDKIWEGVLAQIELEISKPNYNVPTFDGRRN